jgi:hypothetical protein
MLTLLGCMPACLRVHVPVGCLPACLPMSLPVLHACLLVCKLAYQVVWVRVEGGSSSSSSSMASWLAVLLHATAGRHQQAAGQHSIDIVSRSAQYGSRAHLLLAGWALSRL